MDEPGVAHLTSRQIHGPTWEHGDMAKSWSSAPAEDVVVGERVRLGNGEVVQVSKIESAFMGMDTMLAFIEDTQERWFKAPVPKGAIIEIERDT